MWVVFVKRQMLPWRPLGSDKDLNYECLMRGEEFH